MELLLMQDWKTDKSNFPKKFFIKNALQWKFNFENKIFISRLRILNSASGLSDDASNSVMVGRVLPRLSLILRIASLSCSFRTPMQELGLEETTDRNYTIIVSLWVVRAPASTTATIFSMMYCHSSLFSDPSAVNNWMNKNLGCGVNRLK